MKLTKAQRDARERHIAALRDAHDDLTNARDEYMSDLDADRDTYAAAIAEGSADAAEDARILRDATRAFNEDRRALWDARIAPVLAAFNVAVEHATAFVAATAADLRAKYDAKCERSERWQMSDTGAAAETFVCEWETAEFDGFEPERPADLDAGTHPDDIDTDPFDCDVPEIAEELEALPEESET